MTLATKMWVTSPITNAQRDEFWQYGRELIYQFSRRPGPAEYTDKPYIPSSYYIQHFAPGTRDRDHGIGQGFCSMYDMTYHPLGLMAHPAETNPHDEDCEFPCTYGHDRERLVWYVRIELDTSYGFHMDVNGQDVDCSGLHAIILAALGRWLDQHGIFWSWENEFTGEIHQGAAKLPSLISSGQGATDWFHNLVQPIIDAEAAAVGTEVAWS